MTTARTVALDLLTVALLALAAWLTYTGLTARATVPTHYPTPSITTTQEAPRYV